MKRENIVKTIVIIVSMCFLLPASIITTENIKADDTKSYIYCWREGESWDWSMNEDSGKNWENLHDGPFVSGSSDEYYTDVIDVDDSGDYARWDFYVENPGTYKFWIRGYHTILWGGSCEDIRLYWEVESTKDQIGDTQDWHETGGWTWTTFGTKYLSQGNATLIIESHDDGWVPVDKILITDYTGYTPSGTGQNVGSISHEIGERSITQTEDTIELDYDYMYNITKELSDVNGDVNWITEDYGIPKGR